MENNKLIAEFMGAVGTPKYNPTEWDVYITGCLDVDSDDENAQHFYTPAEMKYHTSWDWLMPVVEKIECTHDDKGDCFNVMMEAFECTISGLGLTLCLNGHTKMDATYKAVIEFIKTYNNDTI